MRKHLIAAAPLAILAGWLAVTDEPGFPLAAIVSYVVLWSGLALGAWAGVEPDLPAAGGIGNDLGDEVDVT